MMPTPVMAIGLSRSRAIMRKKRSSRGGSRGRAACSVVLMPWPSLQPEPRIEIGVTDIGQRLGGHRHQYRDHGAALDQVDVLVQRGFQQQGAESLVGEKEFDDEDARSEDPTAELQSLMRTSYAVFCLKKKKLP